MALGITAATEIAKDMLHTGKLQDVDAANVYIVKLMGVRIVQESVPRDVRRALNAAVKAGELGHIKKDGLLPEAYHHKNARARALDARAAIAREAIEVLRKVFVN